VVARLSVYELPEDRVREAAQAFDEVLTEISAARGFVESLFLVGAEGKAVVLTLWQDDDSMAASRVTATRLRSEAVRRVGGEVVSVDELSVARRKPPSAT
jgi:hypothetical protein